jgi:tetratricopeptide (TPR) repeat protein
MRQSDLTKVVKCRTALGAIRKGVPVTGLCFLALLPANYSASQTPPTLNDAIEALHQGNYARAEALLRVLSASDPNSAEILDDLGIAYQLQGKTDDAVRIFEKVLKIKRLPDAVAMLALDFCRDHDFPRAVPLLNEAKAHLDDPNIMATLGPCFLEADQPADAVIVYEKLVNLKTPPEDENAVNLVRAYFDLSRKLLETLATLPGGAIYTNAVQTAKSDGSLDATSQFRMAYNEAPYLKQSMSIDDEINLLKPHPNDPPLLYILGVKCAELAAEGFDRAQDKWPDSIALNQLIAELKDAQGDRNGAIETYEDILAKHPETPSSVHFALGLLYGERRRWDDALEQYRSAEAEAAGSLYLKQRISEALVHLGQNQAVIDLLNKIVTRTDAPFWALRDYGEAAEGLEQEQTALDFLKKASRLDPGNSSVHYHLVRIYHKLNNPGAAEAELSIFRQLSEQHEPSGTTLQKPHLEMASKFDRLREFAKAEAEWRAVLTIDPESPTALEGLSRDLILEGNYLETIALLEDPSLIGQRTPLQIVNLAAAYAGTGKLDESANTLRDGLNTYPDSVLLANHLAEMLIRLERQGEAAALLKVALDRHPQELSTKLLYLRALIDTNPGEAEALGKSLLTSFASNWEVHYLNGVLDAQSGRLIEGRKHLEKSISLNPNSASAHAVLAVVLARLKDIPEAKQQQQKAIALGDNSDEVKRTLSKLPEYLDAPETEH